MRAFLNIRRAGAGHRLRVRPAGLAFAAMLAIALNLSSPPAAQASLSDDLKNLPADASPKQTCAVLIKNDSVKPRQEKQCRKLIAAGFEAAKPVSDSANLTITSAAICAVQVFNGKIKQGQVGRCSEGLAKAVSDFSSSPFDKVGEVVDDVTGKAADFVGGVLASPFIAGFKAIIEFLFGGLQALITVALINWIISVPNLTEGHVGDLEASIAVGAGGLLAATMTISIVRFWGSGLTGDGAWAGAEGMARGAVAVALIGLWPQIFSLAIRLSNGLRSGIMSHAVEGQLKDLFRDLDGIGLAGGIATGSAIPVFLAIAIAIVGVLMLLALVAMKIVITSMTIVLFCAMPLAFVFWPIPELAGIARFCLRSLGVLLAIPVIWCVIFGAFAAIGADTFSPHNTGKDDGFFGTALNVAIIRPLVAISLLYLALVVPRRLLQMAPFSGGGGGMVRSVATGGAIRAGFHYAPRASRALAGVRGGGGMQQQLSNSSSRFGKAAGKGLQVLTPNGGVVGKVRKLRDQSSQASKGTTPASSQTPQGPGANQPSADSQSSQSSADGGAQRPYSDLPDQEHKEQMKQDGLGGPYTTAPPPDPQAMAKRHEKMAAESKSGKGATGGQVYGAFAALADRSDLGDATQNAMNLGNNNLTSRVFTQWSETDNPHVSKEHTKAFGELARAHPDERQAALERFETNGGSLGSAQTETNRPSTTTPPEPSSSSSSRTLQTQLPPKT